MLDGPGPASPTRGVVGDEGDAGISPLAAVGGLASNRLSGLMEIVIPFKSFNDGNSGMMMIFGAEIWCATAR